MNSREPLLDPVLAVLFAAALLVGFCLAVLIAIAAAAGTVFLAIELLNELFMLVASLRLVP